MMTGSRPTLCIATCVLLLAVIFGAFGAHGLEDNLSADQLSTFETGIRYQFYHGLALLFVGLFTIIQPHSNTKWVVIFFSLGILLFSGSLYLISTNELTGISTRILGPITPIGGTLLVIGWAILLRVVLLK